MSNEAFARVKIDALLTTQGWNVLDPTAVRFEVQLPDGTRADYVLCDRHGRSLAVIEAKRYSVAPGDAAAQARAYHRLRCRSCSRTASERWKNSFGRRSQPPHAHKRCSTPCCPESSTDAPMVYLRPIEATA